MNEVPVVFQTDKRNTTGYGLAISKKLGDPYFHLKIVDPYETRTIKLDFHQLLDMMNELKTAEKKELNKRIILGIEND